MNAENPFLPQYPHKDQYGSVWGGKANTEYIDEFETKLGKYRLKVRSHDGKALGLALPEVVVGPYPLKLFIRFDKPIHVSKTVNKQTRIAEVSQAVESGILTYDDGGSPTPQLSENFGLEEYKSYVVEAGLHQYAALHVLRDYLVHSPYLFYPIIGAGLSWAFCRQLRNRFGNVKRVLKDIESGQALGLGAECSGCPMYGFTGRKRCTDHPGFKDTIVGLEPVVALSGKFALLSTASYVENAMRDTIRVIKSAESATIESLMALVKA